MKMSLEIYDNLKREYAIKCMSYNEAREQLKKAITAGDEKEIQRLEEEVETLDRESEKLNIKITDMNMAGYR